MRDRAEFRKGCAETVMLQLLSERRRYGYELVAEIARRSRGTIALPAGTVYPLLYALERKGLVRGKWGAPSATGGRRRKYYEVTGRGRDRFRQDVSHWSDLVQGMRWVLGLPRAALH